MLKMFKIIRNKNTQLREKRKKYSIVVAEGKQQLSKMVMEIYACQLKNIYRVT